MEEDQIRRIVARVMANLEKQRPETGLPVPVGVSARHVHLTQAHVEQLFGQGHQLTPTKTLMGGQYACSEQVTLVGTALRAIETVRVLGPVRKASQVEVSRTDCLRLGVMAPLRDSGDTKGSAPIALVGPKGALQLAEGLIIARRHVHMSPADAALAGLKDGAMALCHVSGSRGSSLIDILVRIHPDFTLEMHVDTDEANALGLANGDICRLTEGSL